MLPATEKPSPATAPAPVDTLRAGVLSNAARGVDHVELPMVAAFVGRNEPPHHLGRS